MVKPAAHGRLGGSSTGINNIHAVLAAARGNLQTDVPIHFVSFSLTLVSPLFASVSGSLFCVLFTTMGRESAHMSRKDM